MKIPNGFCFLLLFVFFLAINFAPAESDNEVVELLDEYCLDCHDGETKKGDLDLLEYLEKNQDRTLLFENLVTEKMPPSEKKQPSPQEKQMILEWLGGQQKWRQPKSFRRISRYEFVHSINDLLGIKLDLAQEIPEDRGTKTFDSDRRIALSREMLSAYFNVADEMLDFAFPDSGFPQEQVWTTNKVKDSHHTYNIYLKPYQEGILFSHTRANNGNSYSFFYDNFDPPVNGWYELTLDAAKVGEFPEHMSLQIYAGKYYYADDRPQPQRLLDVISVDKKQLQSFKTKVFLQPGESVSVHCYSKHTFRNRNPNQGIYIRQLTAKGAVYEQWPPRSFEKVFKGLSLEVPPRSLDHHSIFQTNLRKIGGRVSVSSFQEGMEKENMQDGSNRTFWHTRFKPTLAEPPHFVILENPKGEEIEGLSYATWSGGNGNGQVKAYAIQLSDNGKNWEDPIVKGKLEIRLANEQPILFPKVTKKPFIKFLITDVRTVDGRSLASVGKLDVIISKKSDIRKGKIVVKSNSPRDLGAVIKYFAENAFSTKLSKQEVAPYTKISLEHYKEHEDFLQATKVGLKSILCSPRFLMAPGEHANTSYAKVAKLARIIWLSIPDEELLEIAKSNRLSSKTLREQISRMLSHEKSERFVRSLCDQWLNLRSWEKVTPSLKMYPEYNDNLDHFLPIETQAYLHYLIRENEPVSRLIDSDYTFLNQRLAQHYGIGGVYGHEMRKVSFQPDVPRGGLLTMGAVLKVTTDGYDTSPILRGAWISKNIVGTPLSPPPENVTAIEPDHASQTTTLREQIEQHKNNKTCYSCHKSIDPYGFALESFDAIGQWRNRYRIKQAHQSTFIYRKKGYYKLGGIVDASGEIEGNPFKDVSGLKQFLLSNQHRISYNLAKVLFEYANGYRPNLKQRLDLLEMIPKRTNDCRMGDLLIDVLVYSLKENRYDH